VFLIASHKGMLFPGTEIVEAVKRRFSRSGDAKDPWSSVDFVQALCSTCCVCWSSVDFVQALCSTCCVCWSSVDFVQALCSTCCVCFDGHG